MAILWNDWGNGNMNKRIHRGLWLILGLYLILGTASSVIVPLGESPDEVDHFLYIQHLVQQHTFPVMVPSFADNETMEANQPPLYYGVAALLTGWAFGDESADWPLNACFVMDPQAAGRTTFYRHTPAEQFPWRGPFLAFHLARLLSLVWGAGTVLLAYGLGRELWQDDTRVGLAAAALLAFNPQFIFITASVNNDTLTTFLGAAIVLTSIKLAHTPTHQPTLTLLALLLGLGAVTKFSLLALGPLALLAVWWPAWSTRHWPWRETIWLLGLPILLAGWWYGRAYLLYGDPLAWEVHLAAKGAFVQRTTPLRPVDLLDFALIHFQSYWGWFGWLNIKLPGWVYGGLAGLVAAAFLGLGKAAQRWWSQRPHSLPVAPLFTMLAVLIIYAALFRYIQTINWSGYQGRLAYTVAAPIAALLAVGLASLGGSRLAWGSSLALLPLAVASLLGVVMPAYARPQIYQPDPHLVQFVPTCARFATGWEVEGYILGEPVYPGATVPVTLTGYGIAQGAQPQIVVVQLMGREGAIVGQAQTSLTWSSGQVVSVTLPLPISATALPSQGVIRAGLLSEDGGWQTAVTPGGRLLSVPVDLGTFKLAPTEPVTARPQQIVRANFADQLILLGYDLTQTGNRVTITWYWQAAASMNSDYTFFAHLLAPDGHILGQYDSQPQAGWYPTSLWIIGEIVVDSFTLELSGETAEPLQIAVGVYPLATLERLPVTWQGVPQADNQIILP